MTKAGQVLFSTSPDGEDGVETCRDFVRSRNYTRDDVKIVKLEGSVLVIAKQDLGDDIHTA